MFESPTSHVPTTNMVDKEVKNVHREPHPFVGMTHLGGFVGKTIAFVGRVAEIKDQQLIMSSGATIIRFKGEASLFPANSVIEVRGIVNKDGTISFGEYT